MSEEVHREKIMENAANDSNLFQDIETMLYVSYLVQDIALFNHWNDASGAVLPEELQDPDFFKSLPRTVSQVLEWFQRNMDILKRQQSYTLRNFDPDFDLQGLQALVDASTSSSTDEEATVEVLNDEFGFCGRNSKPVYGITRNPEKKRIVLVFRGSVNARDWEQDAKVQERQAQITQEELQRYVVNPNMTLLQDFEHVKVHAGFHDYLYDDDDDDNNKKTTMEEITDQVVYDGNKKTIMEEITDQVMMRLKDPRNQGYSLIVTGHSLGGSLATHAASAFALSDDIKLPVKLITFASPSVGKADFVRAVNELEKKGRIQHLRITNNDDFVPQGLSIFGYRHTGIHLNLKKETYSLGATSDDEIADTNVSHKWFLGNPSHLLQEHRKRLDHAKDDLARHSFDSLFQDPELRTWPLDIAESDASKEEV